MTWLFFAFLVVFPFGVLAKIPLSLGEVNLYLVDLLVGLLVLGWGIDFLRQAKKVFVKPPLFKPIILFGGFLTLSLVVNIPLLSGREAIVSCLYLVRTITYLAFYTVAFNLIKKKILLGKDLVNFLLIEGLFIAFFGWVQLILWPNLKPLEYLNWDPHFYRLASTLLDPNFTGLLLVFTLMILLVYLFEKKEKFLFFGLTVFTYLSLLLTHSRSSFLAFLTGVTILSFLKRSWSLFLITIVVFGFSLYLLPQPEGEGGRLARTYTIEYRLTNWRNAWQVIQDHPFLGVGFNTYRYTQQREGFLKEFNWQENHAGAGVDNSYLFILVTSGLGGFLSFVYLGYRILANTWVKRKRLPNLILLPALGTLLVHALFINSLFYPWILLWILLLLALG